MLYESFCFEDTKKIAVQIAEQSKLGDIYCLDGELAAGKTFFVSAFAQAIGVQKISSPTFSILNIYHGVQKIYHFDVYRVVSLDDMLDTNYEEYFYGDGICLIEWASIIKKIIPDFATWITIKKNIEHGENYREIIIN